MLGMPKNSLLGPKLDPLTLLSENLTEMSLFSNNIRFGALNSILQNKSQNIIA